MRQVAGKHEHEPYVHQRRCNTHDMDIVEEKPLSQGKEDYVGDVSHCVIIYRLVSASVSEA
jgi:hypothetical protein